LKLLFVDGTAVTEAGKLVLQQALPAVNIFTD
jgi:hypothetical protein